MILIFDYTNYCDLDRYILNDQPTACGLCGARTDFEEVNDRMQIHKCINSNCDYKFTTEVDQ